MAQYGLGRGLDALITRKNSTPPSGGSASIAHQSSDSDVVVEVPIHHIIVNDYQPRLDFDDEQLTELADSIREYGIIQPLVVARHDGGYRLIAGERRLRAAKRVGLTVVPVVMRDANEHERLAIALIENVQRVDLNPIELAFGYKRLRDEFSLTQEEIAKRVGKSRPGVANILRMLNLNQTIQDALRKGMITEGVGKIIMSLETEQQQMDLFNKSLEQKWTAGEATDYAKSITTKQLVRKSSKDPRVLALEERIRGVYGTRVAIQKKNERGSITIDFFSEDQLHDIVDKMTDGTENSL